MANNEVRFFASLRCAQNDRMEIATLGFASLAMTKKWIPAFAGIITQGCLACNRLYFSDFSGEGIIGTFCQAQNLHLE